MSILKHAQQYSRRAGDAPQERREPHGDRATTIGDIDARTREHAVPRHTGYAPTDLGMTCSEPCIGQHSGYAPTDANGPRAPRPPSGGPGGMAGGGVFHSQGGGHHENGLHHSGWGPADARFNVTLPVLAASDAHNDYVPPADTPEFVGR